MPGAEAPMQSAANKVASDATRVANALKVALSHHKAGRLADAGTIYWNILQEFPGEFDAIHLLGMAAHESGDHESALELIDKAISIAPEYPEMHNNRGLVLLAIGRADEAEASFERAIRIKPDFASAYNNLGALQQELGRLDDAASSFLKAISAAPDYAVAFNNMGGVLQREGRFEDAVPYYEQAVKLQPGYVDALFGLGRAHNALGKTDAALVRFQRIAELEPDNGVAQHMIAALTGTQADNAPAAYVRNVFDTYAETFDRHLAQVLDYRTPQLLVKLVTEFKPAAEEKWDVLDLGCGTGLAGAAIAPFARELTGVDLSRKMLEKAASKGIYSKLIESDLLSMLQTAGDASYDVVIAADVFVYVGRLDKVFAESWRVLREGGLLAFSIETLETAEQGGEDFRLNSSGRFSHAAGYADKLAAESGFDVLRMQPAQLRLENGLPVEGALALWQNKA